MQMQAIHCQPLLLPGMLISLLSEAQASVRAQVQVKEKW